MHVEIFVKQVSCGERVLVGGCTRGETRLGELRCEALVVELHRNFDFSGEPTGEGARGCSLLALFPALESWQSDQDQLRLELRDEGDDLRAALF